MDFNILTCSLTGHQVDEQIAKRVIAGEFGKQKGISVLSTLHATGPQVLSISTQINLIAFDKNQQMLTALCSAYVSHFQMLAKETLTSGVNQDSIRIIQKCYDLAESQSYAMALLLFKEHQLPLSGMDLTPKKNYLDKIHNYLTELASE